MIEGTLAITVVRQFNSSVNYTSGVIWTREQFLPGKIEIKAAQPQGNSIWALIYLQNQSERPGNQLSYFRINLYKGIPYLITGAQFQDSKNNIDQDFSVFGSLNDFHLYSVEWNESQITWSFDSFPIQTKNLSWLDLGEVQKFDLNIAVGVGGRLFNYQNVMSDNWYCPSLIIDYVRYYRWTDQEIQPNKTDFTNLSRDEICNRINPKAQPISEPESSKLLFSKLLITGSVILLVSLISMVILILRKRKTRVNIQQKEKTRVASVSEFDQDKLDELNYYEDPKTYNDYTYHKPSVVQDQGYLEIESGYDEIV